MRAAIAIATLVALVPAPARAQTELIPARTPNEHALDDHPAFIMVAALGVLGGAANSIGAIVYAAQNRSFHTPWIATTFLSTAICGAWAGAHIYEASQGGADALRIAGIVGTLLISLWPTAWALRSMLDDTRPGGRFDADVAPEPTEPPEEPRPTITGATTGAIGFSF